VLSRCYADVIIRLIVFSDFIPVEPQPPPVHNPAGQRDMAPNSPRKWRRLTNLGINETSLGSKMEKEG
jgi:hypothetical protein